MNKKNNEPDPLLVDISEEFHSFTNGALFEECIECKKYLLQEDTDYIIEKHIKKYPGFEATDVIYEFAICYDCADEMRKKLSAESVSRMTRYMNENMNVEKRVATFICHGSDPSAFTDYCMIKGTKRSELTEFQISAYCKGNLMQIGQMPYLLSGEVLDELAALLSEKTLDELDGFAGRHFGPPPELMEPLPRKRLVLV